MPLTVSKSIAANFLLFNLMDFFNDFIRVPNLLRDLILEVLELVLNPVPFINWIVCLCLFKFGFKIACNHLSILLSCWDVNEGLDSFLNGPCWHGFEEVGWVRIVSHRHVQVAVTVVLIHVIDITRIGNGSTRLKDL